MASTRDYTDYLNDKIDIAPVNSMEEQQAAQIIEQLFEQHGLETHTQEFTVSSMSGVSSRIYLILMFIGMMLSGILGTVVSYVGIAIVGVSFVLILLARNGVNPLDSAGPQVRSQNVIGVHRATGPNVIKGNRPIVIVAHYDTPRENFLYRAPFAPWQPIIKRISWPLSVVVLLLAAAQAVSMIPTPVRHVLWVVGVLIALPLLLLGAATIYERFAPCTTGANDNKASIAALLGVLDKVRPAQDDAKEWAATHPKSIRRSLEEELEDEIYGDEWNEDEEALEEDVDEEEFAEEYEDDSYDQGDGYVDESDLESEEDAAVDTVDDLSEQTSEDALDEEGLDAGESIEPSDEPVEETYDEYDEDELLEDEEPEESDDDYLEDYEGSDEYADEYDDIDEYDDEYNDAYDDEYEDEYDDAIEDEDEVLEEDDEPVEDPYGLEKPETVRRGASVLENLQVLPESCEIVYENLSPREEVIERIENERAEENALKKRGGIIGAIMGFLTGARDGAARLFGAIRNFFAGLFGRRGSKKNQQIADTQTKAIADVSATPEESTDAPSVEAPEASGFADTLDIDALDAITGEVQAGREDPYGATMAMPLGELLKELRDNLDEDTYGDERETPSEDPKESQFKSQEDALLKELYEEIDRESREDSVAQSADETQVSTFWEYGAETGDTSSSEVSEETYELTDSQAGDELGFTEGAWADAFDAPEAPVENETPTDDDEVQDAGFFLWTPSDMEDDTDEDDADEQEVSDADERISPQDDAAEVAIVYEVEPTDWSDAVVAEPLDEVTAEQLATTEDAYDGDLPLSGVFVGAGHGTPRFDTHAIEDAIDALEASSAFTGEDDQRNVESEAFPFEGFGAYSANEDDELVGELEALEDEIDAEELPLVEIDAGTEVPVEEPEPLVDETDLEFSADALEGRVDQTVVELDADADLEEEPSEPSNADLFDVADEQVDFATAYEMSQDVETTDELVADDAEEVPSDADDLPLEAFDAVDEVEDDSAALMVEEELIEQGAWPVESEDVANEDEGIDDHLDGSGYLDIDWADATSIGYVDAEFEVIDHRQLGSRVPVEVVDVPSMGLGYEIPGLIPSDQLWDASQSSEDETSQEEQAQAVLEETLDESELTYDAIASEDERAFAEESADEPVEDSTADAQIPDGLATDALTEALVEEETLSEDATLDESTAAAEVVDASEDGLRADAASVVAPEVTEVFDTSFDLTTITTAGIDDTSESDGDEETESDTGVEPSDDGAEDDGASPESLQDAEDAQFEEPAPSIDVVVGADAAEELTLDDSDDYEDIFAELPLAVWEPLTDAVDVIDEQPERVSSAKEQVPGVFVTRDDLSLEKEIAGAGDGQLEHEDEVELEQVATEVASNEELSGVFVTRDDISFDLEQEPAQESDEPVLDVEVDGSEATEEYESGEPDIPAEEILPVVEEHESMTELEQIDEQVVIQEPAAEDESTIEEPVDAVSYEAAEAELREDELADDAATSEPMAVDVASDAVSEEQDADEVEAEAEHEGVSRARPFFSSLFKRSKKASAQDAASSEDYSTTDDEQSTADSEDEEDSEEFGDAYIYTTLFEELPDAEWEILTETEDEAIETAAADEQPVVIESESTSETDSDTVEKTVEAAESYARAAFDDGSASDADNSHEEHIEPEQAFKPSFSQLYPQEAVELISEQSVETEKAEETEPEQPVAEEELNEEISESSSDQASDHEQAGRSEIDEPVSSEAASEDAPAQEPGSDESEPTVSDAIEGQVTQIMPGLTFYDEPEISDEDLANVDMTGLTVISLEAEADIEDAMPSVVEHRPRPRAVDDPTWGKSNFKPSVQTLGRRAMLLDLPDPSVMASDPFVSDHTGDTQRMDGSIINEELNRRLELLSTAPLPMITPAIQATDRRDVQKASIQMQDQKAGAQEQEQPKPKSTQSIGSRSPKKNAKRKMSFGKKGKSGQEKQDEPTNE